MKTKLKISIIGLSLMTLTSALFAGLFQQQPNSKYSSYTVKDPKKKIVYKEEHEEITKEERKSKIVIVERNKYVSISTAKASSDKGMIFSKQPTGELVGEDGIHNEIRYGILVTDKNTKKDTGRVYFYAWNNSEKNNEIGVGFGGDLMGQPFSSMPKLSLFLGGQIGIGMQQVKGDTKTISTSLNKLSFVTDKGILDPTEMTYEDNTYLLDIGLNLGTNYRINKDFSIDLAYVYRYNQYQVSYRTAENDQVLNNMSFNQDNYNIKLALNYQF